MVANGHLEKSLESVPGVHFVELDRSSEQAIVEHRGADPAQLTAAAATAGFATQIIPD